MKGWLDYYQDYMVQVGKEFRVIHIYFMSDFKYLTLNLDRIDHLQHHFKEN